MDYYNHSFILYGAYLLVESKIYRNKFCTLSPCLGLANLPDGLSYGDVSDREIRDSPPPSTAVPGPAKGVATQ